MANEVCYATLQYDQPWSMETYLKVGGYEALKKILVGGMSPEDVIEDLWITRARRRWIPDRAEVELYAAQCAGAKVYCM